MPAGTGAGNGAGEGERTLSPGEVAPRELDGDAQAGSRASGVVEVVVGEIPAADDPTRMLWTVRCSLPTHDLVGRFATRGEAEHLRSEHLRAHQEDQED